MRPLLNVAAAVLYAGVALWVQLLCCSSALLWTSSVEFRNHASTHVHSRWTELNWARRQVNNRTCTVVITQSWCTVQLTLSVYVGAEVWAGVDAWIKLRQSLIHSQRGATISSSRIRPLPEPSVSDQLSRAWCATEMLHSGRSTACRELYQFNFTPLAKVRTSTVKRLTTSRIVVQ